MEKQLRRQYLEAIGITPWVPRLPNEIEITPPAAAECSVQSVASPSVPQPAQAVSSVPPPKVKVPAADAPPPWLMEMPPSDEAWHPVDIDELQSEPEPEDPRAIIAGLGWNDLQQHVAACKYCELHKTRIQTVFGIGNQQANLLIIGEAPGADEDRQGEPFVGRAGKLLNAMLKAIGLERNQIYIANILKCRPPGNRDPHAEEAQHCEPYLMRQIALIKPKVIMAVGRVAAQNLLKSTDAVGRLRGRVHHFGKTDIPLVVSYHPAYLLRSPEQKAKAWQDLQQVMKLLKVSDAQACKE